jgi:hypothetical protein
MSGQSPPLQQSNLNAENIMITATIILAGIVIVTAWDSSERG